MSESCVLCGNDAEHVAVQMWVCKQHLLLYERDKKAFLREFNREFPYINDHVSYSDDDEISELKWGGSLPS